MLEQDFGRKGAERLELFLIFSLGIDFGGFGIFLQKEYKIYYYNRVNQLLDCKKAQKSTVIIFPSQHLYSLINLLIPVIQINQTPLMLWSLEFTTALIP